MKLGLDISTRKVGVAITDCDDNLIYSNVYILKSSLTLEERASIIKEELLFFKVNYPIGEIYVEDALIMSINAKTVAILQRFNGMICYLAYEVFNIQPFMVNVSSARSRL